MSAQGRCSGLFYHFAVSQEIHWIFDPKAVVVLDTFRHTGPLIFLTNWGRLQTNNRFSNEDTTGSHQLLETPLDLAGDITKVGCPCNGVDCLNLLQDNEVFWVEYSHCIARPGPCAALGWLVKNSARETDRGTSYLKIPLSSKPPLIFVPQDLFPLLHSDWSISTALKVALPVFYDLGRNSEERDR